MVIGRKEEDGIKGRRQWLYADKQEVIPVVYLHVHACVYLYVCIYDI